MTTPRRGMTLYEIVLSLAILMGSVAVMANMITTGSRAATQSQLRTKAALLCQAKLAEIVAGVEPKVSSSGNRFADGVLRDTEASRWTWDLEVASGLHNDLLGLYVTVRHASDGSGTDATSTLIRFVRNPSVYEAAADLQSAAESDEGRG